MTAWVPEADERARAALASLPPTDELVVAERRRLVDAIEQVHQSCRLLGLDPVEQYTPFAVRADAWLWRTSRLSEARRP